MKIAAFMGYVSGLCCRNKDRETFLNSFLFRAILLPLWVSLSRIPLMMKIITRYILPVALLAGCVAALSAQERKASETMFKYPSVPDTISTFGARADYYVTHFWDMADMNRVFSAPQADLAGTFSDYISLMPHASEDVAAASIGRLIGEASKDPKRLVAISRVAENALYGPSASFWSDDLYIPFLKALADNKKVDKAERMRASQRLKLLENTRIGSPAPDLKITLRDGSVRNIVAQPDSALVFTVLFFNDPDCTDCNTARMRLHVDYLVSRMIKNGLVNIVCVYPGEADDEWRRGVERYPAEWTVGASPDADMVYDVRSTPAWYVLNREGFIVDKNITVDDVMAILYRLRNLKVLQ